MQPGQASQTAAWVAAARTLGSLLPRELVLARDPYGVRFASQPLQRVIHSLERLPVASRNLLTQLGPLSELVLWMQLRTRALDDVLLDYLSHAGTQVVLLGAGFDCRALRFREALSQAKVYEVDHPATQQKKRACLGEAASSDTVYVAWDFERDPLSKLGARLAELGLDPARATLTIWEGVTMYLSESAIEDSVHAVRDFGAEGSLLAFNYIERHTLQDQGFGARTVTRVVKRAGEPYQFGWDVEVLPSWLAARGFTLVNDASDRDLAARYWAQTTPRMRGRDGRRLCIASRDTTAE